MPGRPRRSCDACSAQKVSLSCPPAYVVDAKYLMVTPQLRCCGQKPVCQRCRRLGRPCIYPTSRRTTSTTTRTPATASNTATNGTRLSPGPSGLPESSVSRFHIPEKRYSGVPTALLPVLIDLYYTHLYNASLLLHRPSLTRGLELDTIRTDVLLSICALASRYTSSVSWPGCLLRANRWLPGSTQTPKVLQSWSIVSLIVNGPKQRVGWRCNTWNPPTVTMSLRFST